MRPTILALLLLPACAPINGTYHYSPGNTAFLFHGPLPPSSEVDERNKLLAEYRRKAENKRTADGWQAAEDNHICNSYNPTGCLSPEQKHAMAEQMTSNRNAIECYYGSGTACQRSGGAAEGTRRAQQMLLNDCLSTYTDAGNSGADYFGTRHLPCRFVQ